MSASQRPGGQPAERPVQGSAPRTARASGQPPRAARTQRLRAEAPGPDVPVYVISVAAELTGLHPQTLRAYDRMGLVSPGRTGGGGRRYSWRDIELEGVKRILDLENQVTALRMRVAELEDELTATQYALQKTLTETKSQNLPVLRSSGHAVTIWRRGRI